MSKTRLHTLDIETSQTRNKSAVDAITEEVLAKRPAQNVAKEKKIEWDTESARDARVQEALAKTSLDVLLAEVLCVCWSTDEAHYRVDGMTEDQDEALRSLAEMWDEQAGPETIWIGHNIERFDMPILLNRWRRYHITPPEHFPRYHNGRWRGRIYDTMQMAPVQNGLGFVSCDALCQAYGVTPKWVDWDGEPMDGSRVGEAYQAGQYDLILEYCDADVDTEHRLYMAMTGNDKWGTFDRRSALAEQIDELKQSELSEGARAIAILSILEGAGLVPRVA